MNTVKRNIWLQALAIVEERILCQADEKWDNEVGKDGDGSSWNLGLYTIKKRFEEELDKAGAEE